MSNEAIEALVQQVKDTSKPVEARREALRHICTLRGESSQVVNTIPEASLSAVASYATVWQQIGLRGLTVEKAAEADAEIRAARPFVGRR